jgi:competence protein ComEA
MKGCTSYTDEATDWKQSKGRRSVLLRVVVIVVVVAVVAALVIVYWPDAADEGFAIASVGDTSAGATGTAADATSTDATASPPTQPDTAAQDTQQAEARAPLIVYLTGAVVNQGVYELEQGARVNDAIVLAGGLAEDSAVNYINPAAPLGDGQHIHIPTLAEIESGEAVRIAAGGAVGMGGASTGAAGSAETGAGGGATSGEQRVNINTADNAELESLPGVGVATAQRIIDYREKNGAFTSVEDLMNISGIGEKKYADLVDRVCV